MSDASLETRRRGGRVARQALRAAPQPEAERAVRPGLEGGRYRPLAEADLARIHGAVLDVLEQIGLGEAIPSTIELITAAGGRMNSTAVWSCRAPWSRT